MRRYPAGGGLGLACLLAFMLLMSCSPKCVVRGCVVDAETRQPIKGAAVAIRWYNDDSGQQPAASETLAAVQSLTDAKGFFFIPEYPDKKYVLGVYKSGYICWSSRDIFLSDPKLSDAGQYRQRKAARIKDGMQVDLRPFKDAHAKNLHAGFAVMVAGESTDTDSGPFNEAIQSEYKLWQENLRKDFQKQLGIK